MKVYKLTCIIDDDDIFVFGMKRMIKIFNYQTELLVYSNGKEAISGLKDRMHNGEELPQLIVLDLNMPEMDGWEFLEAFTKLEIKEDITIYMVTSSIDDQDRKKAQQYEEVSGFVIKPITERMFQNLFEDKKS